MERWSRRRWDWEAIALWAPVVGVAATSRAGVGLEAPWSGSDLALTVTGLLNALPLLLRRRWPLVTAGLVALALPVQQGLGGSLSFGTFVAVLVAAYSAGRYAAPRAAVVGVVIMLLGVVAGTWQSLPAEASELVFPVFYVSAATAAGVVVRRLSEQAARLQELNVALSRERDATVRLAVAGERMRLSRDLHDSIAHTLTVAVIQAQRCEQAVEREPQQAAAAAVAIQDAGRRGLSELRSVLRVLRDPEAPVREPGLGDLAALVDVISESGVVASLSVVGDVAGVPEPVGAAMFRVVQESLTNVVKHSAAPTADVAVRVDSREVVIDVVDPGPALAAGLPSGGHGVAVMGERLDAHGGTLAAGADGDGYRVTASVPLAGRGGT